VLWKLEVHNRIHKIPPPGPVLSQIDPVYVFPLYLLQDHFNIIIPSTPVSFKWFFPSRCPTKTLHPRLISPIRATCPTHLIITISYLSVSFTVTTTNTTTYYYYYYYYYYILLLLLHTTTTTYYYYWY